MITKSEAIVLAQKYVEETYKEDLKKWRMRPLDARLSQNKRDVWVVEYEVADLAGRVFPETALILVCGKTRTVSTLVAL